MSVLAYCVFHNRLCKDNIFFRNISIFFINDFFAMIIFDFFVYLCKLKK